ncbi:hypothetical protein SAMN05216303_101276 [Rhodoferax sp. OV413]|uniref:hypothetical protein n=1 Tax=Rhodoferax sp. OV413 TaxID=1855285 RepID=UPI00088A82D2|nr:hypothetical protein [Rhodoferax sp. OV413]SDO01250.1 hypothetical protein SAMN05216303_101276 [Rhodoferax sp. OV413]
MKTELIEPTALIVAALVAKDVDRLSSGHRIACQELFVATYRKLEAAVIQIEEEDAAQRQQPELRRA